MQECIKLILQEPTQHNYDTFFANLINFPQELSTSLKNNVDLKGRQIEYFGFIMLDSLIFNLYTKQKNIERAKANHSLYTSGEMSSVNTSNLRKQDSSILGSSSNEFIYPVDQGKFFNTKWQELLDSKVFFDNLKELIEQARPSNEIKFQLQLLLDTIQYIKMKEKLSDKKFKENKKILHTFEIDKEKPQIDFDEVNEIIFGDQMDKILTLIAYDDKDSMFKRMETHLCLGRIYFAAYNRTRSNFSRKCFQNIKYSGRDMLHNIFRRGILFINKNTNIFPSKQDENSNDVISFVYNLLHLLFLPHYKKFYEIFEDYMLPKFIIPNDSAFFEQIKNDIVTKLIPFLIGLPADFTNIFVEFYEILQSSSQILNHYKTPVSPLRSFFWYRFFLDPDQLPVVNPFLEKNQKFIPAINTFKFLLHPNEKQCQQFPDFKQLSEQLHDVFVKIVTYYNVKQGVDIYNYYITDPLIRNDYEYLHNLIKLLNLTRQDSKSTEIVQFKPNLPQRALNLFREIRILQRDDNEGIDDNRFQDNQQEEPQKSQIQLQESSESIPDIRSNMLHVQNSGQSQSSIPNQSQNNLQVESAQEYDPFEKKLPPLKNNENNQNSSQSIAQPKSDSIPAISIYPPQKVKEFQTMQQSDSDINKKNSQINDYIHKGSSSNSELKETYFQNQTENLENERLLIDTKEKLIQQQKIKVQMAKQQDELIQQINTLEQQNLFLKQNLKLKFEIKDDNFVNNFDKTDNVKSQEQKSGNDQTQDPQLKEYQRLCEELKKNRDALQKEEIQVELAIKKALSNL